MRRQKLQIIVPLLAIVAAGPGAAQITSNPIPAPIEKRGLAVEIVELARLPDTRGIRPADQDVKPAGWARVNYVRDLPDGRRFANDSRGFLYRIDSNNQPHVYANLAETFPLAVYNRLSSGFIAFRLSSGVRAKRPVLHRACGARAGQSGDARLHPARVRVEGRDLPQHRHGVARDESGRQRVCGHPA